MHSLTKCVPSPNANPKLIRKRNVEINSNQTTQCHNTQRVAPRPSPICISHPPPASQNSSHPCPSPPLEVSPPPSHAHPAQQDAAACFHSAAYGSAQSGTPGIRTSYCAPFHASLYHQPRQGETAMEPDNSLAAKSRCHTKLDWDSQTFVVMARVLEDSF